jgi:hypothetical protein
VRCLPEFWRLDAAGTTIRSSPTSVRKSKEAKRRTRKGRKKKNNGLVFLEFFTFLLENLVTVMVNICFAKL